MIAINQHSLRILMIGIWIFSSLVHANVEGAELPSEIKDSLIKNAQELGPIQVKWQTEFAVMHTEKDLTQFGLNLEDIVLPNHVDYCWQKKRLYVLVKYVKWNKSESTFIPSNVSELAFDGTDFYSGSGKRENLLPGEDPIPVLEISPLKKDLLDKADYFVFQPGYLEAAGYHLPSRFGELLSNAKSSLMESILSGNLVSSVEKDSVNGVAATKVVLKASDGSIQNFWLSSENHFSLIKYEKTDPQNRLLERTSAKDFRPIASRETELPSTCRVEYFAWGDKPEQVSNTPILVKTITLLELEGQVLEDERFRLVYDEGGSVVSDSRPTEAAKLPKGKVIYTVPARKGDLENAINAAKQGKKFNELNARQDRFKVWLIAINVLVFIVIFAWYLRHKATK